MKYGGYGWPMSATTKSAYSIQFKGSYSRLNLSLIWKAKAEPRCKFFTQTLMHQKILMANNLQKRSWPNNPTLHVLETHKHLCKDRPFTKEVWTIILPWFDLRLLRNLDLLGTINKVWRKARCKIQNRERRNLMALQFIFVEHLERAQLNKFSKCIFTTFVARSSD